MISSSPSSSLPIRNIPGDYGLPFFGPIRDRYDYFYKQGKDDFFKSRMKKYSSTVFRTNMPPGPFISSNPHVIVLLDTISFPILFDTDKIEKKDILDGTYMTSTSFFGGYRVCTFLDPSEPKHSKLKQLCFSLVASRHNKFIPLFQNSLSQLFDNLDSEILEKSTVFFNTLSDSISFDYLFRLFFNKSPSETKMGSDGESSMITWLALQLAPKAKIGSPWIPNVVEDLLLHTFKLPSFLAKSGYEKIYESIYVSSTEILDEAEKLGISREEACHNLVFNFGFNAYAGTKRVFPALFKWIGLAGKTLHTQELPTFNTQLADAIRAVVMLEGRALTFTSLEKMPLTKSVVYETFRMEPPVPFQYGKAKQDLVVQSHEAAFEIKKVELICGYQPIVTRDPKVFKNPEEFVGDRFVGMEGETLLKYVYWSNAWETENPTVDNKQCAGRDLVVLMTRLMVVEFFLRYDTFTVETGTSGTGGSTVTITSLTEKAT
ncbi:hypothetical protein ACHQM5_009645 [Ranunculus cassubicifolius]